MKRIYTNLLEVFSLDEFKEIRNTNTN